MSTTRNVCKNCDRDLGDVITTTAADGMCGDCLDALEAECLAEMGIEDAAAFGLTDVGNK